MHSIRNQDDAIQECRYQLNWAVLPLRLAGAMRCLAAISTRYASPKGIFLRAFWNHFPRPCAAASFILLFAFLSRTGFGQSPPGAALFEKKCYSCHNIGNGNKKGPDLQAVTTQRSREWLHSFIQSPVAMNRKGDPAAAGLFKNFAPEVMPDQALSAEEIDSILSLINTLGEKKQIFVPAGAKLSRPVAPGDVEAGLLLFKGKTKLARGGSACIACHHLSGVGTFGGGTLGPNLTAANIRYRDPELISILQNPNFPTMNSVFAARPLTDEEVVQLFAVLQNSKRTHPTASVAAGPFDSKFPLAGLALLACGVFALNAFWRSRLRGVREALVERSR